MKRKQNIFQRIATVSLYIYGVVLIVAIFFSEIEAFFRGMDPLTTGILLMAFFLVMFYVFYLRPKL